MILQVGMRGGRRAGAGMGDKENEKDVLFEFGVVKPMEFSLLMISL